MRVLNVLIKKTVSLNVFFILLIACLYLLMFYGAKESYNNYEFKSVHFDSFSEDIDPTLHTELVDLYYNRRKDWLTSNLGSYLFKNVPIESITPTETRKNTTFLVLIWKYWGWLKNRHVYSFGKTRKHDPLEDCSVKNCKFTGEDGKLSTADAVIIHVQKGVLPNATSRNLKQRWIFLSDESPINAFSHSIYPQNFKYLSKKFNWSMTYRSDSDVPVPYGRTVPLEKAILNKITEESLASLVPYWKKKRKDVLVSILISHCGVSRRMEYLQKLQKHMTVDVHGQCSKDKKDSCPGHFRSDCNIISEYLFYLVFENSQCEDYLTEKLYYNAYSKGAIPVIMGPTAHNTELLLPPGSFLHIDNFDSPKKLAEHMIEISEDRKKVLAFHRWRNDFLAKNEHGYFGSRSYHLCRICEALNYNDQASKTYDEESLRFFLDPVISCR